MKNAFLQLVNDHSFNPVDGGAISIGVLGLIEFLPELSAGLSAVWVLLRIYVLIRDEIIGRLKGKKNGDE